MLLTVDSSVIIASIIEEESRHEACELLMTKISNAEHTSVTPYSVLVEVVGTLKRRTGSDDLAEKTKTDLQNIGAIVFVELTKERAEEAADIAKETGLKGMDAIVVQAAKENNATLVTLDNEIMEKSKQIVKTASIESLASESVTDSSYEGDESERFD